ncbi:hypothetical protein TNCV_3783371 [Trichonephila clavipes]|nr:hypothetical protein TNCV_3783371 [Trichonephila clavipes]
MSSPFFTIGYRLAHDPYSRVVKRVPPKHRIDSYVPKTVVQRTRGMILRLHLLLSLELERNRMRVGDGRGNAPFASQERDILEIKGCGGVG